MSTPEARTFYAPLRTLFDKGVRYSTVIDVGCADGHFFLNLSAMGLVPGAVPLNIDANLLYEDSLRAIKDVVGGEYRICAAADREGHLELTTSVHPYWSSLRPASDGYWERINRLSSATATVPATTLDALSRQLALRPPFLLKLDVQGAEASALRGASDVLANTEVVVCEADIEDFQELNAILAERGFFLYDLTSLVHLADGTLGWFYPIYVSRRLDFVRPKAFWSPEQNDAMVRLQEQRRQSILESNAEILARIRNRQATRRNDPCPCGSGRKYKHCCGAQR